MLVPVKSSRIFLKLDIHRVTNWPSGVAVHRSTGASLQIRETGQRVAAKPGLWGRKPGGEPRRSFKALSDG